MNDIIASQNTELSSWIARYIHVSSTARNIKSWHEHIWCGCVIIKIFHNRIKNQTPIHTRNWIELNSGKLFTAILFKMFVYSSLLPRKGKKIVREHNKKCIILFFTWILLEYESNG